MIEVYRNVLSSLHTAQRLVYVKERTVLLSFILESNSGFGFQISDFIDICQDAFIRVCLVHDLIYYSQY
jgi:hypothetical protein